MADICEKFEFDFIYLGFLLILKFLFLNIHFLSVLVSDTEVHGIDTTDNEQNINRIGPPGQIERRTYDDVNARCLTALTVGQTRFHEQTVFTLRNRGECHFVVAGMQPLVVQPL